MRTLIRVVAATAALGCGAMGCDGVGREAPPVTIAGAEHLPVRAQAERASEKAPLDEPGPSGQDDPLGPGTEEQLVKLTEAKRAFLTNQYEVAEKHFVELVAMEPISSATVSGAIALGQIYLETNRRAQALALYESFARRVSGIAELNLVLARTYASMGESQKALEAYEKAFELDPSFLFILP
jgi:tetratricopeptide (TPR) repeat protein